MTKTDAAQAVRDFTEALGGSGAFKGTDLRFDTRIEINLMDLFAAVSGELGLAQFGPEEGREDIAENIVRHAHRTARENGTVVESSRSGE